MESRSVAAATSRGPLQSPQTARFEHAIPPTGKRKLPSFPSNRWKLDEHANDNVIAVRRKGKLEEKSDPFAVGCGDRVTEERDRKRRLVVATGHLTSPVNRNDRAAVKGSRERELKNSERVAGVAGGWGMRKGHNKTSW